MDLVSELQSILAPDRATENETILEGHSSDESYHTPHLPDVVVYPKTTEEVSGDVSFANEHQIPVVPFVLGSSLDGSDIPYNRGINIDMSLMNEVTFDIAEDFHDKVHMGSTRIQLEEELKKYVVLFPDDPGADEMVGSKATIITNRKT